MEKNVEERSFYEGAADEGQYFNFHLAGDNITPAHFHSNMEIVFVKKKAVTISINGIEKRVTEGGIALSNSFDVHYYNGEADSKIFVLVFSNSYFLASFPEGVALENFYEPSQLTQEILVTLDYFFNKVKPDTLELRSSLVNLIVGLLLRISPAKKVEKRGTAEFHEILSYIYKNINSDISCESVAASFGFTKNYFSMLFNRYTGMHFRNFVNRIRCENVQTELKNNPQEPITKAVLNCGFQSLNTYYRATKILNGH